MTSDAAADARLEQRISFDLGFALLFITALHGFSAFKVLFLLYVNYKIATALPHKYVPAASWIVNIGVLFANELCRGYPYSSIFGVLPGSSASSGLGKGVQNIGTTLDQYGGLVSRWEVLFNITILRLLSFNMDYYWAFSYWSLGSRGTSPIEVRSVSFLIDCHLTRIRRRTWIPPTSLSAIAYPFLPNLTTTPFATIWRMRCTRLSTLLVPS